MKQLAVCFFPWRLPFTTTSWFSLTLTLLMIHARMFSTITCFSSMTEFVLCCMQIVQPRSQVLSASESTVRYWSWVTSFCSLHNCNAPDCKFYSYYRKYINNNVSCVCWNCSCIGIILCFPLPLSLYCCKYTMGVAITIKAQEPLYKSHKRDFHFPLHYGRK